MHDVNKNWKTIGLKNAVVSSGFLLFLFVFHAEENKSNRLVGNWPS